MINLNTVTEICELIMKIHIQLLLSAYFSLVFLAEKSRCKEKHAKRIPRELLRKSVLGPSWEFQGIDHKWKWKQEYSDAESEALSVFVNEFERSHAFAKTQLLSMFGKESVIESRLKPIASIGQDLDADGNRTVKDIYDVVTWRVAFPTVQQLLQAKHRFIKDSRFTVAIVKCFGVCHKAGKYADTGYRGITLIAEVDGKPAEIQLVTPYMVMWADWAYSVLLQKSTSLRSKDAVTEYAFDLADYYYNLDTLRNKRPGCPKALLKANMETLIDDSRNKNKIYESLGSPPSSCQFWNDLNVNKEDSNGGARRAMLDMVAKQASTGPGKGTGNKPSVIDIDKILKPDDLKDLGETKRSFGHPVHYYY